jgi:hypothetical protein
MDTYGTCMTNNCSSMSTSTSSSASKELYDTLMSEVPERFRMNFCATVTGLAGAYPASGTLSVTQAGGSGATCTTELAEDNNVTRITIVSTGSGYSNGGDITISNGGGTNATITILAANITSIHIAYLNGTLNNTNGTALPLLSTDTIRCKSTITPNNEQRSSNGNVLVNSYQSNNYSVYCDFTI